MKKTFLSLAMACILALPLTSALFAAPKPEEISEVDWLNTTFIYEVITPHDYLGEATIGNLWRDGELSDRAYPVFVVDDSAESFEINCYTTSKGMDFFAYEEGVSFSMYDFVDGRVEAISDTFYGSSEGTKENPMVFKLRTDYSGGLSDYWQPETIVSHIYLGNLSDGNVSDGNYGWMSYSGIVFTQSEVAAYKGSGELPIFDGRIWSGSDFERGDLSPYVDLTEVKALLDAYTMVAAPASPSNTVDPTASVVSVNGEVKSFEAYSIEGNNYFKLRDLAAALADSEKEFEIGYDDTTKAITITSKTPYTFAGGELLPGDGSAKAAEPTASKIYLDGTELNLNVYNVGGSNFFKLRDVMKALDVFIGYDDTTKAIALDTSKGYVD